MSPRRVEFDPGLCLVSPYQCPASRSLTPGLAATFDSDGFALADIAVADGKISSIAAHSRSKAPADAIDLGGRIVLPCFVDCHTHIDKGHIWPRKPNPDGTFMGALNATGADRAARWNAEDVARRMDFSLRSRLRARHQGLAHASRQRRAAGGNLLAGVRGDAGALARTDRVAGRLPARHRRRARDRIGSRRWRNASPPPRACSAPSPTWCRTSRNCSTTYSPTAIEHGLDLDFHADETDDVAAISLKKIAEAALWNGFEGNILVGHCCSLARQPDRDVLDTLDKVAKAGLAVVSLPMCNLYLQDRRGDDTTPRWRGVTLLHEMKARGIPVAVASDNTRDPFYAYGDLDMLEVYRMATRILHFDHPVGDWPQAVASTPAEIMRLDGFGTLAPGGPADFVIFKGRSWTELLSRPESDRIVVRDGKTIERELPDYAELDDLMV